MKSPITLGAIPGANGVHFTVWAPKARTINVVLQNDPDHPFPLQKNAQGFFEARHPDARTGALYRYRIDGQDLFPDPASRFQPQGVHGPSQIINPRTFRWTDAAWRGIPLKEVVLYELHVGTFTPKGTFAGIIEQLPHLAKLGITCLELMPVADFAGSRNWGYDGVSLFAPSHAYGKPDHLRRLVDRAHDFGLAVMMDVVYNHLGPDGNYLGAFSPYYFTGRHKTPWGAAVNFDSEQADKARSFFIQNAQQWVIDYHMDGLRLDATHAMMDDSPRHFLAELSERVRAAAPNRKILVIAEDCRNLAHMIKPETQKGWGMDAVWSDDFHHEVRRSLAGDHEGYFEDFSGSVEDLAVTVQKGWFFQGQKAKHFGGPRGTDPTSIPLERFVVCLQNHDQVGNRAFGERLNQQIDAASYRAASVLLLSVPETPLLFMGQEWAASSPFLFFTDHHDELGKLVTEGRRAEFKSFSSFTNPAARNKIPDPQALATFERSRLNWSELNDAPHASVLRLYQRLLRWRKDIRADPAKRMSFTARAMDADSLWLEYGTFDEPHYWVVIQWRGGGRHDLDIKEKASWHVILTTEDRDVAPDPRPCVIVAKGSRLSFDFQRSGAVILSVSTPPHNAQHA